MKIQTAIDTLYGVQAYWYPGAWTFIDVHSMVPRAKWGPLKDYTDQTYDAKIRWGAQMSSDEKYMRKLLVHLEKYGRWKNDKIKWRLIEVNIAMFVRTL